MTTNTDCHSMLRLIDLAVDGELSMAQRASLDAHLTSCASCRTELAAARSLREIMALGDTSLVLTEPLEESTDIVMSRIAVEHRQSLVPRRESDKRLWLVGSVSLAASLLIFSMLIWYHAKMTALPELASFPNRVTSVASPMMIAVSADDRNNAAMTDEEEALLATGMLTLATPGVMSRIEAASSAHTLKVNGTSTPGSQRLRPTRRQVIH